RVAVVADVVSGTDGDGIAVEAAAPELDGNVVADAGGAGVRVTQLDELDGLDATIVTGLRSIERNAVTGSAADGIVVAHGLDIGVHDNHVADAGGSGIVVKASGAGPARRGHGRNMVVVVAANTIERPAADGIGV